jgi:hypothetical protein
MPVSTQSQAQYATQPFLRLISITRSKKRQSQGSWWKEKQWRPTTSHALEQMTFRLWEEAQFFSSVFCSVSQLALRCYFHLLRSLRGEAMYLPVCDWANDRAHFVGEITDDRAVKLAGCTRSLDWQRPQLFQIKTTSARRTGIHRLGQSVGLAEMTTPP